MEQHPEIPESLREMVTKAMNDTMEKALQEAFNAGYLKGADDVTQRLIAAAKGDAPAPPARKQGGMQMATTITKPAREVHPNSMDARRFPYGAVANAFREALRKATFFGLTKMDLIDRVSEILESDVSNMDHRDTIKRLKKANELRINEGRYFAGPGLMKPRNENGALHIAASAPEAGGVAPPPNENSSLQGVMS